MCSLYTIVHHELLVSLHASTSISGSFFFLLRGSDFAQIVSTCDKTICVCVWDTNILKKLGHTRRFGCIDSLENRAQSKRNERTFVCAMCVIFTLSSDSESHSAFSVWSLVLWSHRIDTGFFVFMKINLYYQIT